MTTKVLIVNFGPEPIAVTASQSAVIYPTQSGEFWVWAEDGALTVSEVRKAPTGEPSSLGSEPILERH